MATIGGNSLVIDSGMNLLEGFHFMLRVEAVLDLPCKSVKGFIKENEYEYIQEDGPSDYVHMRREPMSKPFTSEVERYVPTGYIGPLSNRAELVLPVILLVSHEGGNFLNGMSQIYTFTGCTVTGKQYDSLGSESSGLLTGTAIIAYRQLLAVDVPRSRNEPVGFGKKYKMSGNARKLQV